MSADYQRLVSKVDEASKGITERRASDLACRAGCAGCCHVELTVADVEAAAIDHYLGTMDPRLRARVADRAALPSVEAGRCVMLDDDDRCAVHPARPLVCRTQGLPLLYPDGLIPAEAIRLRTSRGDVTVCPLNFVEHAPTAEDMIDAGQIDTMLALIARLDAEKRHVTPGQRTPLREIARRRPR